MDKIIAIAIDNYNSNEIQNLSNCLNDVNSLLDILTKYYHHDDLDLILYSKPEQTTLSFLYKSIYQELFNLVENDKVLIIYAGHGDFDDNIGNSYWYCSDSDPLDTTTWFNLRDLLSFFSASKAKHIALISDSCFSGTIFEMLRGGGNSALTKNRSRQALTSGGSEPVSDGVKDKNSPFNLALQKSLQDNEVIELTFNQLCENTIRNFSSHVRQTPQYGALSNVGDERGTYIFKKKENVKDEIIFEPLEIPLNINKSINIESDFKIPFFLDNKFFDSKFVNAFVQQIGFSIVNDIRIFFSEDVEFYTERSKEMPFSIEVNYETKRQGDKTLSVVINVYNFFGAAHPNYYTYTVNFAFNPDRKISLFDILESQDKENLIKSLIDKYAEDECKDILHSYANYEHIYHLDFAIDNEFLYLYFVNLLPHAFKACGYLQIPIREVTLKI